MPESIRTTYPGDTGVPGTSLAFPGVRGPRPPTSSHTNAEPERNGTRRPARPVRGRAEGSLERGEPAAQGTAPHGQGSHAPAAQARLHEAREADPAARQADRAHLQ